MSSEKKQYAFHSGKDKEWNGKKIALFKALRRLGATDEFSAVQVRRIHEVFPDIPPKRFLVYAKAAASAGLIGVVPQGAMALEHFKYRGDGYYLTEKGLSINLKEKEKEWAKIEEVRKKRWK